MGIIFYELLYGKTPFPANTMEELKNNTFKYPLKFPFDIKVSE